MRNFRLQHRIFLYFSLLIIMSTILFGYYAYQANVRTAEDNFTSAVKATMTQAANGLEGVLNEAEKQANLFAASYAVQESLSDDPASVVQQYDRYLNMERVVNAYEKNYDSFAIRLFLDRPRRFMNDGIRYFDASALKGEEDAGFLFRRNSATYWELSPAPADGAQGGSLLSVYRSIFSLSDISTYQGTVAFDLKPKAFAAAINGVKLPDNRRLYLFDDKGRGLYDSGDGGEQAALPGKTTMNRIRQKAEGSFQVEMAGGSQLLVYERLRQYPIYMAVYIPLSDISNRSKTILYQFIWVMIAVLTLTFAVAYGISRGVTRRLKRLMNAMGQVESHEFNIQVPTDRSDEIGILTRKFNWMIERIRLLIEDVYKSNYEKKAAELKLLQAQINPHFCTTRSTACIGLRSSTKLPTSAIWSAIYPTFSASASMWTTAPRWERS
ncbi:hypothetical protein SD70_06940 [Gordoniibacillus kamchatkensis]|uniref:histidine kinase n=1 Tax=Gordoniibacillus kamchatkensis TaxID=1590651 RepID=A0ABR5AK13_9BACL|nr:HAMP domain-containing protein [Paenibacillus sp. VKM B-2647]KIL41384.1 hypothetical protein SD70_06940 [Paenibacillus sp. VKM B-2647]